MNRPPEPKQYVPSADKVEGSSPASPVEAPEAAAIPLADLLHQAAPKVKEFGGRQNGLDPTRYGDWEKNGRCIDF